MSKALVRFDWDCGRMGEVFGVFVADKDALEKAYGKRVYFGEILGKHSEVYGTLDRDDIQVLSEDADFIAKYVQIVGDSGYNPLEYIEKDEE